MHLRLATDADAPLIGKLFRDADYPDHGVDWAAPGIAPWWLVADGGDGTLCGAVMVIASQPYGFIGEIVVHPDHRGRNDDGTGALRGIVPGTLATALYVKALQILAAAGSALAFGVVHEDLAALKHILQRHGAECLGRYDLLARRLA